VKITTGSPASCGVNVTHRFNINHYNWLLCGTIKHPSGEHLICLYYYFSIAETNLKLRLGTPYSIVVKFLLNLICYVFENMTLQTL
jgi:hypothetical protein